MLVIIEGNDKAGKATQTRLLREGLEKKGFKVADLAFPVYDTKIGKEIKAFLNDEREYSIQVRHMLLSANRWEKKAEIEKLLGENKVVIFNRYYQSNLVYGLASGLKLEWLQALDEGLFKGDIVIVLDVAPEVSIQRMTGKGDIFEMNDDVMYNVSKLYRELAVKYGWILVNGYRSREDVHREIIQIVEDGMKQKH
ncbi:MAG: dTMP kinase [Thaumarchaeota archaeon]|nr:dTMP kinase [Nitrososphaerota archaeon]|tara:strand:+ start:5525 stop:6112 length:588 start_codon:yes stop_codon:yes gene_type:complete